MLFGAGSKQDSKWLHFFSYCKPKSAGQKDRLKEVKKAATNEGHLVTNKLVLNEDIDPGKTCKK